MSQEDSRRPYIPFAEFFKDEAVAEQDSDDEWVCGGTSDAVGTTDAVDSGVATDAVVDIAMDDILETWNLTEGSVEQLKSFVTFLRSSQKDGRPGWLPYHFLIEGTEADATALAQAIAGIPTEISPMTYLSRKVLTEAELEGIVKADELIPPASILIVNDCPVSRQDTTRILSSIERADIRKAYDARTKMWHKLDDTLKKLPGYMVFVCASKETVNSFFRRDDQLYYRFLAHHITILPWTMEQVRERLESRISDEGFTYDAEFRTALDAYIDTVYPKADLKDSAFVEDLKNRILVSYYSQALEGHVLTKDCVPYYRTKMPVDRVFESIDQLVGLRSVKESFRELYRLQSDPKRRSRLRLNFLFMGNPGTGKTTVAHLTAELLFSMGLIQKNKLVSVNASDMNSSYVGMTSELTREKIEEARGGVLFIDEAYSLISYKADSHKTECLNTLVAEMDKDPSSLTVIMAGYQKDMMELLKTNAGLSSRFPYRYVFEDYTEEELYSIFRQTAERDDAGLAADAEKDVRELIALSRLEESFGNARTVENIYQKIKAKALERSFEDRLITREDVLAVRPEYKATDIDSLIGLSTVKEQLIRFEKRTRYVKYAKDRGLNIPDASMHMIFAGNPGTGKTTVARMIADILYRIGVMKSPKLTTVESKDLLVSYVGSTASRVDEVIRGALGGVLFIDEAYGLTAGRTSAGDEAVTALITAMEKYKADLVIICAGYRAEMEGFRRSNPGLESRIGYYFDFPDYTPEELVEIFRSKADRGGWILEQEAEKQVMSLMEYFPTLDNFGNGRFVDKVIDQMVSKRAMRSYKDTTVRYIGKDDIPTIEEMLQTYPDGGAFIHPDEVSDEHRRRTAFHEAGHAVVLSILVPGHMPDSVSVVNNARSFGRVSVSGLLTSDSTEEEMRGILAMLLSGRNSEREFMGSQGGGCSQDYQQAKRLAGEMVENYAMGTIGRTTPADLLKEADQISAGLIRKNRNKVRAVAEVLMEKKSITGDELLAIVAFS